MRFEDSIRQFEDACAIAKGWKNYFGAAYTTRLTQACNDLEIAIKKMRQAIKEDNS